VVVDAACDCDGVRWRGDVCVAIISRTAARVVRDAVHLGGDENSTDIFRSYLKSNSFREVEICLYPSPDIQHLIPYPYPNTQIAYL